MARQSKTAREEAEAIYIKYAEAFLLCRHDKTAALGIGIAPEQVDEFLEAVKYSPAAVKILTEDATFIPDFKSPDKVKEAILQQLWREARSNSSSTGAAARVSALKAIGEISGLSDSGDNGKTVINGGLLMVPVMKLEDWEKQCAKAQRALRATSHE